MTKFEQALSDAEDLPPAIRDRLGEELLHKVHALLALRDDLALGLAQLNSGDAVDGEEFLSDLRSRYGA